MLEPGATPKVAVRNPDWTRDETILLLDLYLQRPKFNSEDAGVQLLSRQLNAAPTVPANRLRTYRNPAGVAMKLRNLAKQDPGFLASGLKGLRGGGVVDSEVWQALAHDRAGLAIEVARICLAWDLGEVGAHAQWRPSHGPRPHFGVVPQQRGDGDTDVYLLQLEGPVSAVLPTRRIPRGWAVMKVGRSNNIARRCVELNSGLPPAAILRWQILCSQRFPSAIEADRRERRLLNLAAERGWSLGGEFVLGPVAEFREALDLTEL